MFDIAPSEFMLVAFVALVVIGPKDLPKAMRIVGYWVGKARGVARQFRSGFDEMVREAELAEMEKKWAAENERIMREHPAAGGPSDASASDNLATAGSESAPAASSDGVTYAEAAPATSVDSVADEDLPPVHVEKPTVEPAPYGTPSPRGDGVTS